MGKIKLDHKDVELIKDLCTNTKLYDREIAGMFGVTREHINKIRNGIRWNYESGRETNGAQRDAIERIITDRRTNICR